MTQRTNIISGNISGKIISGNTIGIFRLSTLIAALELEIKGMKGRQNAYMALKRALNIKGNREKVLAYAKEVREDVRNW